MFVFVRKCIGKIRSETCNSNVKKLVTVQVAITVKVVTLKIENVLVHFIATSRV
jgi:hypothetical protein